MHRAALRMRERGSRFADIAIPRRARTDGRESAEDREWPLRRAGRGCGKMAAAVATESCEVKCADVPRDVENATTDRADAPRAATPRRQTELYRFRATDLLYYASSVSFFFADVATGEQRVSYTHTHTCTRYARVRATRGVPAIPRLRIPVDRSV